MTPINTGSFSKALWPGINAWYGKEYAEFPVEWTDLFDQYSSRKAFEEDVGITSFGLAQVKPEGSPVTYDTEAQAFITRYTHIVYALGFIITREAFDDDQYDIIGERRAKGLAFAMRQTKENVCANVYNRAFNAAYVGGDGVQMISTAHPNASGGTWSNRLAVDSNLSEAALEQATIDIGKWTNDRGLRISVIPQSLHIPVDLQFEAQRIMKTKLRVSTANNDISAIESMGLFPKGFKVNHYFTSQTAWFLRTNVKDGMKYFERKADTFAEDNDFDTDNAKFKASCRYSVGWTDPRGVYGTSGV
jgi:hypothetical protein